MSSNIQKIDTDVDFGFGEVEAIMDLAIRDGLVSFSTDTSQIFVDFDGARFCFDSIIMYDTELEIISLTSFARGKLFFAKDTKNLYMNNGGKWEIIFESTGNMLESLPVYTDLEYVDGELPEEGNPKHIYLKKFTEDDYAERGYAGVPFELYLYNEDEGFFRVIPTEEEIVTIINKQFDVLSRELDARLVTAYLLLGEHDSADANMQEAIAEALSNYYTRSLTYSREEIEDLFVEKMGIQDTKLNNALDGLRKTKSTVGSYTPTPNTIVLGTENNLYVTEAEYIITFDISELPEYDNSVYSFDLVIRGCNAIKPVINENVVWLENATPDYTFANVLINFKTFDKGATWLGSYQGGWNGNSWII